MGQVISFKLRPKPYDRHSDLGPEPLPVPMDTDRASRLRDNMPARTMDPDAELEEIHPDTPIKTAEPAPNAEGQRKAQRIFTGAPKIGMRQRVG